MKLTMNYIGPEAKPQQILTDRKQVKPQTEISIVSDAK